MANRHDIQYNCVVPPPCAAPKKDDKPKPSFGDTLVVIVQVGLSLYIGIPILKVVFEFWARFEFYSYGCCR